MTLGMFQLNVKLLKKFKVHIISFCPSTNAKILVVFHKKNEHNGVQGASFRIVMESLYDWKTKGECAVCGRISERFPVYYCPQKHQYCQNCFRELKFVSKGNGGQLTCLICNVTGQFMEARVNPEGCNMLKQKPGIGRPYRYNVNTMLGTKYNYSKNYQDFCTPSTSITNEDEEKMFEALIGMTKEKFYECQAVYKQDPTIENSYNKNTKKTVSYYSKSKFYLPSYSKKPFKCPHKPCHKTVALAQFVNHFKSEHKDVQICSIERGKELLLPCDISVVEHDYHFCLAMITVYEINRIDVLRAGSSESVIRTCNKFCQKIPLSTFWLMVTGSSERKLNSAYCLFWLFTNSEESHKCTIELGSKNDSMSLSTYCGISTAFDKDFSNFRKSLHCLIATKSSLRTLLKEGAVLNLRVTVH